MITFAHAKRDFGAIDRPISHCPTEARHCPALAQGLCDIAHPLS